ncbi:hypothetical protein [Salinimicrobium sp. WS361]|uniref:hypothetical protein n=1 Tax=Salinimicrobium sp. WS361 TaxID=3425123 RepID=UPI003D6DF387
MAIKPILFSTPMVQAIMEDRKTQTRRIKGLESKNEFPDAWNRKGDPRKTTNRFWDHTKEKNPNPIAVEFGFHHNDFPEGDIAYMKAKVKPGDILWVRETWVPTRFDYMDMLKRGITHFIKYKADNDFDPKKELVGRPWKPSIHMPKAACRIFLEVTNVRVERLQDISEVDAIAEGLERHSTAFKNYMVDLKDEFPIYNFHDPVNSFNSLWQSINGKDSWKSNPWVWVYDFKRTEKPANFLK